MKKFFIFLTFISFISIQIYSVECELNCKLRDLSLLASKVTKNVNAHNDSEHSCCKKKSNASDKNNHCLKHENEFENSCNHGFNISFKKSPLVSKRGYLVTNFLFLDNLKIANTIVSSDLFITVSSNDRFRYFKPQHRLYILKRQLLI